MAKQPERSGPLSGITVLELGSTVAAPFCGRLLADFGAEVIKIEPPEGDAVRHLGKRVGDRSLYAASIFRNKKLVAINLRTEEGRALVRRLAAKADILVENFRPGTMESWGLDFATLSAANPGLVMVRISGFGQTGPYRHRPGFGVTTEAVSGLRELTGYPDRPPVRAAVSLTDYVSGVYGAFGAMMALSERTRTGRGQVVDMALYESAFSMLEPYIPAYSVLGVVPTRTGSRLPNHTPSNLYPTADGKHIHIAAGNQRLFRKLAQTMGQPGLAHDRRFAEADARSENEDALDEIISAWTRSMPLDALERLLHTAGIPAERIYTVEDIFKDPHYRDRDMLLDFEDPELGRVTLPGVTPKLSETPGRVSWMGGETGQDTEAVLHDALGLSQEELETLSKLGAVACASPSTPRQ